MTSHVVSGLRKGGERIRWKVITSKYKIEMEEQSEKRLRRKQNWRKNGKRHIVHMAE